ncbi:hypothetical protein RDABS01_008792 [Bienertia sinuspersici]
MCHDRQLAVLVNGSPTEKFSPSAGMRQGDPLSPYIFLLCMEVLSRKIASLQLNGVIKGIEINRKGERISHLFFADDALFYFEATPNSCNIIRDTLEEFCEVSGEIINYRKSHVQFSRNTPTKFIHFLRKPLAVGSQQNMGTYLGCPMDVDGRSTKCFTSIHDKTLKSISSWKYACLSTTGRSILINNVLMALAAHIMNIYLLPRKLLNKINSTILRFFRGGNKEGKPIYWKKQSVLEPKKEEGGIGLRNVSSLNQALLFRQVWRMERNPNNLASRVLHQKYGGNPLQIARRGKLPAKTSWVFKSLVKCSRTMLPGCGRRIGNGHQSSVLEEVWAGKALVKFKNNISSDQGEKPRVVKDLMKGRAWDATKVWQWFNKRDALSIFRRIFPNKRKMMKPSGCIGEMGIIRSRRDIGSSKTQLNRKPKLQHSGRFSGNQKCHRGGRTFVGGQSKMHYLPRTT